MKAINFLIDLDKKLMLWFTEKAKQHFSISIIFKLISNAALALLVVIFSFVGTMIFEEREILKNEKAILDTLKIGESKDYSTSKLGVPIIDYFVDGFNECYYTLEHSIVHAVFEDENLVAYFITITNDKMQYRLLGEGDGFVLGKNTFEDYTTEQGVLNRISSGYKILLYFSGDSAQNYYAEIFGMGRMVNYSTIMYGFLPYGCVDEAAANYLMDLNFANLSDKDINNTGHQIFLDNDASRKVFREKRRNVKPNTFGVIQMDYEDRVKIGDENRIIYYLLTKQ